jgi:hypothetical protein
LRLSAIILLTLDLTQKHLAALVADHSTMYEKTDTVIIAESTTHQEAQPNSSDSCHVPQEETDEIDGMVSFQFL